MRALLAVALLFAASPVLAEETICTPEYYYNSAENPPIIIPIDEPRARGTRVSRIDIETGAYRENFVVGDGAILATDTLTILNPGSLKERIDFVALNPTSGLMLHISLIDDGLPFARIDAEGTVSSGHCVYEYDQ